MKKLSVLAAVLFATALLSTVVRADDRFWTLDFKHTGLHYVSVDGTVVAYTTYEVTNNTGAERKFFPIFRVETDTRQITYAMASPQALEAIRLKQGVQLLDINQMCGSIKVGETKRGVAIFHKLDPVADHVHLYISGLTDAFRYQDDKNRQGFQRRVWYVHWFRPGDGANRPEDRTDTRDDSWIWRSTGVGETAPVEEK
jgi:hypothetical protein